MKGLLIYIGISILWISCTKNGFELRNGDLLFQVGKDSEMTAAIQDATALGHGCKFTHVAIAIVNKDSVAVIEASTERGVCLSSLENFMQRSACAAGKYYVAVGRLKDTTGLASSLARAISYIGQPYDYAFLPDNGALYCSELVYQSYLTPAGSHIFTATPMNFRDSTGMVAEFWTKLFAAQGSEVPEGIAGTNPNDMSQDKAIDIIYNY